MINLATVKRHSKAAVDFLWVNAFKPMKDDELSSVLFWVLLATTLFALILLLIWAVGVVASNISYIVVFAAGFYIRHRWTEIQAGIEKFIREELDA